MLRKLLTLGVISAIFLLVPSVVWGQPFAVPRNQTQTVGKPSPLPVQTPNSGNGLDQNRLRSCEARQQTIMTRSQSMLRLANNMEEVFDSIATRVEDYYNDKVVPGGNSLSNYNELVANINEAKLTVENNLQTAQNNIAGFSCTAGDPKGLLQNFNSDMREVKSSLQEYRKSVRDLIVAIRSIVGTTNSNARPSPNSNQ